jgi:hypothetical protein
MPRFCLQVKILQIKPETQGVGVAFVFGHRTNPITRFLVTYRDRRRRLTTASALVREVWVKPPFTKMSADREHA